MLSDWSITYIYNLLFTALQSLTWTSSHGKRGVLRKMESAPHQVSQKAAEVLVDRALTSSASTLTPAYQHQCVLHAGAKLSWQLRMGGASSTKRKEVAATNYHFAVIKLLALIWLIFMLIHGVLNQEGLKFTEVSSKGRVKYFLGFGWQRVEPTSGEEAWPRKKLRWDHASPRRLCLHGPKAIISPSQFASPGSNSQTLSFSERSPTLPTPQLPKHPADGARQEAASEVMGVDISYTTTTGQYIEKSPYAGPLRAPICVCSSVLGRADPFPLAAPSRSRETWVEAMESCQASRLKLLCPACQHPSPHSRNTFEVQQLLQKRRKVSYLVQHRLGRGACERHAIKTGW